MRIHKIILRTRANGPGVRLGIWVQGCTKKCPGCSNPETHDISKGFDLSPKELFSIVLKNQQGIEGISISGGEPLDQLEELIEFLQIIKNKTKLTVLLWTGYTLQEMQKMPLYDNLRNLLDAAIVGPYLHEFHEPRGLKGSSNQDYVFFSTFYRAEDFLKVPIAEIIFNEGEVMITGINTEQVKRWFK